MSFYLNYNLIISTYLYREYNRYECPLCLSYCKPNSTTQTNIMNLAYYTKIHYKCNYCSEYLGKDFYFYKPWNIQCPCNCKDGINENVRIRIKYDQYWLSLCDSKAKIEDNQCNTLFELEVDKILMINDLNDYYLEILELLLFS